MNKETSNKDAKTRDKKSKSSAEPKDILQKSMIVFRYDKSQYKCSFP